MSSPNRGSLAELIDLVQANDPDAAYRLPLLEQAAPMLFAEADLPREERVVLADRLERWRYQLLNKRDGNLPPPVRLLADALDQAAGRLIGPERPPRQPRRCLQTEAAEADRACDPAVPLEEVAEEAARLTVRHFPARDASGSLRRRMFLYAPIYLSSYCVNHCRYCGFRYSREQTREHLSLDEALAQADILGAGVFATCCSLPATFPA